MRVIEHPILVFAWGPVQILNFTIALAIIGVILTIASALRIRGPQPVAYGHIQTLADLIDELPTERQDRIYWGHKYLYDSEYADADWDWDVDEKCFHAGTSSKPLASVKSDAFYA